MFVSAMDDVVDEISERKAGNHDVQKAIDKMKHGFSLMEERIHSMERFKLHRFEASDARYAEHKKSIQKQLENHTLATQQQIITFADKMDLRF